jgi:hypothetical protein
MTVQFSRRGFLQGLFGVSVIAALPTVIAETQVIGKIATFDVKVPDGITYNWVRTSLLGVPDIENLQDRLNNGWTFVAPAIHPELPHTEATNAIDRMGLVLMQCPTVEVDKRREAEEAAWLAQQPQDWQDHVARTKLRNVKAVA